MKLRIQPALNYAVTEKSTHYFNLTSNPKALKLYNATHTLTAEARWDRYEWLRRLWGLKRLSRQTWIK